MVAVAVAKELGIPRVIVPPGPGAFCAFGMLLTDVVHDFAQTRISELSVLDEADLTAMFADLESRARAALESDGFGPADSTVVRSAELRFAGQEHTVEVPVPDGPLTRDEIDATAERFAQMHLERYGHRMSDPVELVTARLRGVGTVPRPELPLAGEGDPSRALTGSRDVFLGSGDVAGTYPVYWREYLGRGQVIRGPAIVEEHTATTVFHLGDELTVGDHGELRITIASPDAAAQGAE